MNPRLSCTHLTKTYQPHRGRKKLSHQNLLSEIISQLANRFAPDMAMVKKRIESLIDREYLERIEGSDPPSYRYLA